MTKLRSMATRRVVVLRIVLLVLMAPGGVSPALAGGDLFPVCDAIKPNVTFWTDVFTRYPSTTGVLHDRDNLNLVYGTIDLLSVDRRNARRINEKRMQKARVAARKVLERLAKGAVPRTPEEIRIASVFGSGAGPVDFKRAVTGVRCQKGLKDRFKAGLVRSGPYIEEIRAIFESMGLPPDLAYLPHVESSFDLKAYSKCGAAGIWQFTRSTGKRYLAINYSLDERRDPIQASKAAARLLKSNYEKLGSWPLAITAYNHGASGTLRAKKAHGDYGSIVKHYNGGRFGFASRNFYSEFLAAREAAIGHQAYFAITTLPSSQNVKRFVLPNYASAADLASNLGLAMSTLKTLNPALRKPIFLGQKYMPKGYVLNLPAELDSRMLAMSADQQTSIFKPHQKHSHFHRVERGETASRIARNYNVRLSQLIALNSLGSRAIIYENQNLMIPGRGPVKESTVVASSRVAQALSEPARQLPRVESEKPPEPVMLASLESDLFSLPAPTTPINPAIIIGDLSVTRLDSQKERPLGIIRVQAGETIGHYADWLAVSAADVRRLNGFKYRRPLQVHERVRIPLGKVSPEAFEEKRFEFHKGIEEDFFASYQVDRVDTYVVQSGDSIWTLARDTFDLPFWLVVKYNSEADLTRLKRAQKLWIPVVESNS
jgi:membrane-bound lytic murein transglycosylase D